MQPETIIVGQLRRNYLLPPQGRPLVDVPGGNLLYAASGLRVWLERASLLSRVGEDYPQEWLRKFESEYQLETQGVRIIPETLDLRSFYAYAGSMTPQRTNPVAHFARLGLPFPKLLLGYQAPQPKTDSRVRADPDSPRLLDIPSDYYTAKAVHLCPLDYVTHLQMIPGFRQTNVTTITVDPGANYMEADFLGDVRSMLKGVSAFLPSEEEIRALFWGRTNDLWQMAEDLGAAGCDYIVIKRGALGQLLYDSTLKHKWEIPAYPARIVDPTGAGDAFGGGFIAGFEQTYDGLQATLYGNISASISLEGSGVFHALEALPGLARARLQSLADIVRRV